MQRSDNLIEVAVVNPPVAIVEYVCTINGKFQTTQTAVRHGDVVIVPDWLPNMVNYLETTDAA